MAVREDVRILEAIERRRVVYALGGGVLCQGAFKLYLYVSDRAQFKDSNLLVSSVFVLLAAGLIYLIVLASSRLAAIRR